MEKVENLPVYYPSWLKSHLGVDTTPLSPQSIHPGPRGEERGPSAGLWGRWSTMVSAPLSRPSWTVLTVLRVTYLGNATSRVNGRHMGPLKALTSAKRVPDPECPSSQSRPLPFGPVNDTCLNWSHLPQFAQHIWPQWVPSYPWQKVRSRLSLNMQRSLRAQLSPFTCNATRQCLLSGN